MDLVSSFLAKIISLPSSWPCFNQNPLLDTSKELIGLPSFSNSIFCIFFCVADIKGLKINTKQTPTKKDDTKIGILIFKLLSPLFIGPLKKMKPIHSEIVAKAMLNISRNDLTKNTFESNEIVELSKI